MMWAKKMSRWRRWRRTFRTRYRFRGIGLACALALAALLLFLAARDLQRLKTRLFIQRLDPARYVRQGTDFGNSDYTLEGSARRVGVPPERLDRTYDYDFFKLIAAQERLAGIERRAALRSLFERLTAGARSDTQRHLEILKFLHQASLHNPYLQPMHPDRTMVADPLVLLELGEMRCGHVAKVAVDLFAAAGYCGRIVPLGAHTIAEIEYDGGWHYLDADLFGNGSAVVNSDGTIPSVAQMSRDPIQIDSLPAAWEPADANALAWGPRGRVSYYYFSRRAWNENFAGSSTGPRPPYVIHKTATPAQERSSRHYGWESLTEEPAARQLHDLPPSSVPGAPQWESIQLRPMPASKLHVALRWNPSADDDGDLLGYRVMVSRHSRGWGYNGKSLPDHLMGFKSCAAGWRPEMYEARFTLPKSEIALMQTRTTAAELTLAQAGDYYITVMPYDTYGEQAGQRLYPMSEEIRIRAPEKDDGSAKTGT